MSHLIRNFAVQGWALPTAIGEPDRLAEETT